MTSIRALAEKVLKERAEAGCFTFHALGDETVKHEAKSVVEQELRAFHAGERPKTAERAVSGPRPSAVSGVSPAETGVKRQGLEPGIPALYRGAFEALCALCPAGVPEPRWCQTIADAERFLREWGATAERLGWTADDLFGLHPTVPLSRVDHMGALWLCKGERVAELTETTARFERGLAFYRRAVTTGAAP